MVWTSIPGHGRVFFTLGTRPDCPLTRLGVAAGDRITFTIDGIRYEWVSQTAVATPLPSAIFKNSQAWNVWGYHEREWKPFGAGYHAGGVSACPIPKEARATPSPR